MHTHVLFVAFASAVCAASGLAFDDAQLARLFADVHVPATLQSTLSLTPAQLKLYAGHALGVVTSRCPHVDRNKLQHLNKYISKLIAHKNSLQPTQDAPWKSNERFLRLVNSMKTCAKTTTDGAPSRISSSSPLPPFSAAPGNAEQEEVLLELPFTEPTHGATRGALVAITPAKQKSLHEDDSRIESFFQQIFGSMGSFFAHVLPSSFNRGRRAAQHESPEEKMTSAEKGKRALVEFLDEVCRLYCSSCRGASGSFPTGREILDLKMATKELRDYLTTDQSFATVASLILDDQLMAQVRSCERTAQSNARPVFVVLNK